MKNQKKVIIYGVCYFIAFALLSAGMPLLRNALADAPILREQEQSEEKTDAEQGGSGKQAEAGELEYSLNTDGTATVVGIGTYSSSTLTIPSKYEGHAVTAIKQSAFYGNKTLRAVVVPDTVQTIGSYAFSNCTQLQSVVLPKNLTMLSIGTFKGCKALTDVTIPEGLTSIGSSAFSECTSLCTITLPQSLTKLYSYVFENCTSLQSLTIPNRISHLPHYLCRGCTSLTKLVLPKSLISIGMSVIPKSTDLTVYCPFSRETWINNVTVSEASGIDESRIVFNYSGS